MTGKDVVSVEDLRRIKVVYAEAGFECVSLVLPFGDLAESVQLAMEHGIQEGSKQLGLQKQHLHALPSAPLVKPDGSPIPVKEWVNNHFVIVKMRPEMQAEGLLGKYLKQHVFLEETMRKGIADLGVSTAAPNVPEELQLLRKQNADLRTELAALQTEVAAMKVESVAVNADLAVVKAENETLKADLAVVKEEIARPKEENARLKAELEIVQKKIANLSGMDLVMARKMLEACRTKCRTLLAERKVQAPYDWNKLICNPMCSAILNEAGLTIGLPATEYGKKSPQKKGSEAAHNITESPEAYATIVCKMHGSTRQQMMNIFEFVFGARAEDLAFDEIQ